MINPPVHAPITDFSEARAGVTFDETIAPDLKVEINTFLWTRLPPTTTLGEADALACEWYEAIRVRWDAAQARLATEADHG